MAATVLIVDDDPLIRQFVELVLAQEGYNVSTVGSGELALKALQQAKWDLVLLDIEMPDMSGLDLLELLRKYQKRPVRVMMMTARRDAATVTNSMVIGADGYLIKPFVPEDLIKRVKSILNVKPGDAGDKALPIGPPRSCSAKIANSAIYASSCK